jgi:hypothetical protein
MRSFCLGFEAEVDVWHQDGWYLGHDGPVYPVSYEFLCTPGLWLHCKHYEALQILLRDDRLNCFYHSDEDYVLTTYGYIWAYPGMPGDERTICVMPERTGQKVQGFAGVCSDFVNRYR